MTLKRGGGTCSQSVSPGADTDEGGAARARPQRGDLFPLPVPWELEEAARPGLSRGVRQRIGRRRARTSAAIACVQTLNSMSGSERLSGSCFSRGAGPSQDRVLRDVWEACQVEDLGEAMPSEDAAFRALLCQLLLRGRDGWRNRTVRTR